MTMTDRIKGDHLRDLVSINSLPSHSLASCGQSQNLLLPVQNHQNTGGFPIQYHPRLKDL